MKRISVATEADLPALMNLLEKGVADGSLARRSPDEVLMDIKPGGGFVCRENGAIVGMAFLSVYSLALAEIRSFYVDADHRGNCKGIALISSALVTAWNIGIKEVMAITRKDGMEKDKKGVFARAGFRLRDGFETALFRKRGSSAEISAGTVENATLHDLGMLMHLMEEGEKKGMLIARSKEEVLRNVQDGNAFVYRGSPNAKITGMAFLSVYSQRLAELRNLYAAEPRAAAGGSVAAREAALAGSVAARADALEVNETMLISKNGNGSALASHGFASELNDLRMALFADLGTLWKPESPALV
jgi:N-acetylglutamate synthase-like GNAT family acetyltransferase